MKLLSRTTLAIRGMTFMEMAVAIGIGTTILAGFTTASVALQRSFVAIEDYAKGMNDQMRISDYLSLDMRRAFSIGINNNNGVVTVTMTIPNFYVGANSPYDPYVVGVTGWPYKKHHHHKHQNIILNQIVDYGPYDSTTKKVTVPTKTVTYVFDNGSNTLTRNVNGASTAIATDVKDFNVSVSDLDETATTQITFQPRFRSLTSAETQNLNSTARVGTTYYQTTLTRNTR